MHCGEKILVQLVGFLYAFRLVSGQFPLGISSAIRTVLALMTYAKLSSFEVNLCIIVISIAAKAPLPVHFRSVLGGGYLRQHLTWSGLADTAILVFV